jgi:hypothetical protein
MYIEAVGEGQRPEWARIGRVSLSKTGKTLFYRGHSLHGIGRSWYRRAESESSTGSSRSGRRQ